MTSAILNHEELAAARLLEQDKNKVALPALIRALTKPFNSLDAAFIQLLLERAVSTAIGVQLDIIGSLVGITRASIDASLADADYRRYVRAQIWTLRSYGIPFDVLRVMRLVIDDDLAQIIYIPEYPAGLRIRIDGVPLTDFVSDIAAKFLCRATAAGVRCLFESSSLADSEMFTFAEVVTQLNGAHGAGATTLTVDSTAKFPSSGTLVIEPGTAAEETRTFTVASGTTLTVPSTSNAHGDDSIVQINGAGKPLAGLASNLLEFTTAGTDADEITIGNATKNSYEFKNTLSAAYQVKIGSTKQETAANFLKAINNSGVPGTDYGTGTVQHPEVGCEYDRGSLFKVCLYDRQGPGTGGNSIEVGSFGVPAWITQTHGTFFMINGADGGIFASVKEGL